jgi:glycogen(starch) synthase
MFRVLHVLDHSLPLHSGYAFRTRAIMTAQSADGLEVKGLTGLRHYAEGPDVERAEGLTFHRTRGVAGLAREWGEIAALTNSISALVEEWRPDVLHAHSPALCGMAALRAARRHGLPLVYEIRAFWEDASVGNGTGREGSVKYRLARGLENRVVAGADAVMTICHGLRDDLIARGFPGGKIGIMPNGVDLAMFGDPPPRDGALRDELALGEGPVIGFIGSFYDYEGLDDLIEAMPLLLAERPDARLLMVGGGPVEDALRRQAQRSPAAHAIRFVGRVPHAEVERYYSLCDVMTYPRKAIRLTELVTPLKPLEAMAQGKLVAASSVGGHRELVADGLTGTLFAPDDPGDCAASLAGLLARRGEWDAMRAVARAHVAEKHDWARNARRYRGIYQALLGRGDESRLPVAA